MCVGGGGGGGPRFSGSAGLNLFHFQFNSASARLSLQKLWFIDTCLNCDCGPLHDD